MSKPRYNVEFCNAETGEDTQHLWQSQQQVAAFLRAMKHGDSMIVNRTEEDAEEGHIYL